METEVVRSLLEAVNALLRAPEDADLRQSLVNAGEAAQQLLDREESYSIWSRSNNVWAGRACSRHKKAGCLMLEDDCNLTGFCLASDPLNKQYQHQKPKAPSRVLVTLCKADGGPAPEWSSLVFAGGFCLFLQFEQTFCLFHGFLHKDGYLRVIENMAGEELCSFEHGIERFLGCEID